MKENILEIKNLSKSYKKELVLDNLSFSVEQGAIVGFVGDNGAGKTTTIKAILNIVNFASGDILYNGESIKNLKTQKQNMIGFFPDLNNIPLNMTILDYAIYLGVSQEMNYKQAKTKAVKLSKTLLCEDFLKKKFKDLSSGQKKKGLLLGMLMNNHEFLILDEPTANLDVKNRYELLELIKSLNERNKTIFITSHIIDELEKFITHLIIINKGQIVYNNKFDKDHDDIKKLYDKYSSTKQSINISDIENI